jgi:DNA-binding GntR family transcriptional regulator
MIHSRKHRRNEHLAIRDAVLARDIELSCTLIEQHIRTTVEQAASEVPGLVRGTPGHGSVRVAKRKKI